MSYLQFPRLVFSGKFQTDPSTVNNDPEHFDTSRFQPSYERPTSGNDMNGWWNPKGTGAWRFRDCVVQQVEYLDGSSCDIPALDPVVGMPINSVVDRVEGKLVDLDPEQQMVSAIWGFQVFLGSKDNPLGFGGDFQVASFADIWSRFPKGQPDSFFGAYYQSIINLTKDILNGSGDQQSRFLDELKSAIGNGMQLSIKFNVDGYDDDRTSPTFTYGRVTGTIGAYYPGEPAQFVAGRCLSGVVGAQPALNTAYALVQDNFLHLDLGNSLPTTGIGGPLLDFGNLVLATVDENNHPQVLGEVKYTGANWYESTAGIVSFKLTPQQLAWASASPLSLEQLPNPMPPAPSSLLQEASNGQFVRADQFVFRFNPNPSDSVSAQLYATQFGKPLPKATISFLIDNTLMEGFIQQVPGGLPGPGVGFPTSILSFPGSVATSGGYQITTDDMGIANLNINATDPGNPRKYIDGQVYGIAYQLGSNPPAVGQIQNPSQLLNLLVFDAYAIPETPTWIGDVAPIFEQYAQLYPIMRRIVDLGNYGSVMQHRYILKNVFSTPETDANYMPVTRDLSKPKREMILKWLENPVYLDTSNVDHLKMALQSAIELEHATIPAYLTAYYSIKPGHNTEVAALIRSVVIEEMLHMSLVCNILISIGGSPNIGKAGFIPNYPGGLPGGLRNDLIVSLKKCSIDHIRDCFMSIEMPEQQVVERMRRLVAKLPQRGKMALPNGEGRMEDTQYTIGWFYDQITAALSHLSDEGKITFGNAERQLSEWKGTGTLYVIQSLQDALNAIEEIKEQGEGNSAKDPNDADGELSHYYKFSEIVEGRRLVKATGGGFSYTGPVIPFDPAGVWPMINNPSLVSYPAGSRAALLSTQFTEAYQALLEALHTTFNGNPANIRAAIGAMYSMGLTAAELMQTPSGLEEGTTAGPQFVIPS